MPLSQAQTKVHKNSGVIRRSLCSSVLFLGGNKPNRRMPPFHTCTRKSPGNGRRGFPTTQTGKDSNFIVLFTESRDSILAASVFQSSSPSL